MSHKRVATYRIQLHRDFGFGHIAELAGYLKELGISHLYLSPILQARSGSQHGYDVVDHTRINEELGGMAGLRALAAEWPGGIVVDIVPNHMAVTDPQNRWWWDVLKRGPGSDFAEHFDIDWDPAEERLKRSILVPILGDHYGRVLERSELTLDLHDGEPIVRYHEHMLPLAPSSRPHDITAINGDVDRIHDILEAQHYRLAYWRVAGEQLNYRRFFAITDLAALRADRMNVFQATHETLMQLVDGSIIDGFRVDHIDGLRYPREYLERLASRSDGAYVVVEKILEGEEELAEDWPIAGTTGYEFIARVDALFVDPEQEKPFSDLYDEFTGVNNELEEMTAASKSLLTNTELATDIERLTELFVAICEDRRQYRDFTRTDLREALRETLVAFDVYRTYVDARTGSVVDSERVTIDRAIRQASDRRPDLDGELFGLLADVLLVRIEGDAESELATRFQQVSSPVMAKGIEDTLFYRYNRFVALNEVGGAPEHFGRTVDSFHHHNERIARRWPQTMLASSTHDTKRSEDVRARLGLLSEIPEVWADAVTRWAKHNDHHRGGGEWPDRNLEYLLYQTLVGAWPLSTERAVTYMDKAAKEAKVHTSWISPNEHHDGALRHFVTEVMADSEFNADLESFVAPLIRPGYVNSLAHTLLKMTAPGIPDFYQGTELWNFSLVDPDNRRPVDYSTRRQILEQIRSMDAAQAWREADSGAPKLFLIHRALAARHRRPTAFDQGAGYTPLSAEGTRAANVIAFARGDDVITVVPRLTYGWTEWVDTAVELPAGSWTDALSGDAWEGTVRVENLLASFPVALLERDLR